MLKATDGGVYVCMCVYAYTCVHVYVERLGEGGIK